MEDWILGLMLVFLGCCCSAIGLVLLKHSTNVEEHLPLTKRPFWAIGVIFLIVNASVIDVIAFSLTPLTLVAPFSGVTIVLTTWLASSGLLFIKEQVDIWDTASTGIALAGVTMTTAFGPHIDDAKGASELAACFGRLGVHIFAAVAIGITGGAWLGYFAQHELRRAMWYRISVYAYTAALAGSASMLLLKVVGTGMRSLVETGQLHMLNGVFFGSLVGLISCAVVQLGFLHRTLANSPVSYGVPTYQTLLTVMTIIAGGIFFDEFVMMQPRDFVWFCTGVVVSLVGVGMHSLHRAQLDAPKELPYTLNASCRPIGSADTATPTTMVEETAMTPGPLSRPSEGDPSSIGGTPLPPVANECSRLIPR